LNLKEVKEKGNFDTSGANSHINVPIIRSTLAFEFRKT